MATDIGARTAARQVAVVPARCSVGDVCPYSTPCVGGTMAKSEEGRWLTYEELANELGCTVGAARILAVRRKYPRRIPNAYGERTRVLVPEKLQAPRHRRGHVGDTYG